MTQPVENPEKWRFVIRVYALIINDLQEVLLSDEYFNNTAMTKFPGGGLEFGEGTTDCLKREAIEEFGQEIDIIRHFYTTDFFQPSLFHDKVQLISIYYLAKFIQTIDFKISDKAFDFISQENGSQSFRWKSITLLTTEDVTYPIDKQVVSILKANYPITDISI